MSQSLVISIAFICVAYLIYHHSMKLHWPAPLLLIFLGILAQPFINQQELVPLLLIVFLIWSFDIGSRFLPKKFDTLALLVSESIIYSIAIYSLVLGLILHATVFDRITALSVVSSLFLGVVISATSQFEMLRLFKIKNKKDRLFHLTELEDHLSNAFVLALGFLLFFFMLYLQNTTLLFSVESLLSSFLIDIAVGVVLGIISVWLIVHVLNRSHVSLLGIVVAALAYFIAVEFGGFGFISVLVLSLFAHNTLSTTIRTDPARPFVLNMIHVIIFFYLGLIFNVTFNDMLVALLIFVLYLLIRYLIHVALFKQLDLGFVFDCPKGIVIGILSFLPFLFPLLAQTYFQYFIQILLMVSIYSIVLSFLLHVYHKEFFSKFIK